ncbi:MAG: hypothetical protein NTX71_11490 [Candidatus Aureabacteria bacterium]|nr:hypothetical protein [Candidatus Auribacterota bacterium]
MMERKSAKVDKSIIRDPKEADSRNIPRGKPGMTPDEWSDLLYSEVTHKEIAKMGEEYQKSLNDERQRQEKIRVAPRRASKGTDSAKKLGGEGRIPASLRTRVIGEMARPVFERAS